MTTASPVASPSRYRVRFLEFVGEKDFTQGYGMTWDDVILEIPDGEEIIECKKTWKPGDGFCAERACVQVWLKSPTDESPTPTAEEKKALEPPKAVALAASR